MRITWLLSSLVTLAAAAYGVGADATRGAEVLRRENCLLCHSVRGEGGSVAPDLGRRIAQNYTPAALTSLMWNHAPAMWAEMDAQHIARPRLTEQDASDLFAYL